MSDQFLKRENGEVYNLPYDYESIMHYSGTLFNKQKKLLTIQTKNPVNQNVIGKQTHISAGDVKQIKALYGCSVENGKKYC